MFVYTNTPTHPHTHTHTHFYLEPSSVFMTLIHCCVDTVKLNIMQRGVLAVSFMVINGKTRYKASKS